MTVENKTLLLDFVEWIAKQPRTYTEVMDAWRTSCPRFPIWEDAVDRGFVAQVNSDGPGSMVHVTATGRDFLRSERGIRLPL